MDAIDGERIGSTRVFVSDDDDDQVCQVGGERFYFITKSTTNPWKGFFEFPVDKMFLHNKQTRNEWLCWLFDTE